MLGSGVESVDLIVKQHDEEVIKQKSGDRLVWSTTGTKIRAVVSGQLVRVR
jgi:hypothetical protein